MRYQIRSQGIEVTHDLQQYIRTRLNFALARISPQVSQVHIYLRDENGPRGGVAERCILRTKIGGRELIIERTDCDIRAAISTASARLGDAARRTLTRSRMSS
ncbi:MAG TPA: HPF/RaiA family ribosome-associated protein [Pseudomonadota bacterium]|nr:HPF/RaiA family ribosome-associated protein [Pseudomonadota bacterium]